MKYMKKYFWVIIIVIVGLIIGVYRYWEKPVDVTDESSYVSDGEQETVEAVEDKVEDISNQESNDDIVFNVMNSLETINEDRINSASLVDSIDSILPRFSQEDLVERSIEQCFLTRAYEEGERSRTEALAFTSDEVKNILLSLDETLNESKLSILGLVESSPGSMFVFFETLDSTYVSEISYESQINIEKASLNWRLDFTRSIDHTIDRIYKDVNTIWFDVTLDKQRYLLATNHDFTGLQSISIPSDLEISDVFYGLEDNLLVTQIIIKQEEEDLLISMDYTSNESEETHYVHVGEQLYANGKLKDNYWHYHNSFDLYYNQVGNEVLRISNQGLVIKLVVQVDGDIRRHQEGDLFAISNEQKQNIYLESINGQLSENDLRYSPQVFGGMWKSFPNGDYLYIDKSTKEFVRVNGLNEVKDRIKIPNKYLGLLLSDEHNPDMYWSIVQEGIGIFYPRDEKLNDGNKLIVYYDYQDKEYKEIDLPENSFAAMDSKSFYYSTNRNYKFDFSDFSFHKYYKHYKDDRQWEAIVYKDVFYYPDLEYILAKEDESILSNPSFLPLSQLGKIEVQGQDEDILKAQSFKDLDYLIIQSNQYLLVDQLGNKSYINDFPVRTMEGDEKGIVYTGYEENISGYYYELEAEKVFSLPIESTVDDIRLMDDLIIVLSDNKLYAYNRDLLVSGGKAYVNTLDLESLIESSDIDEFYIDVHNDKIIAYIDSSLSYKIYPSQTFILSKNMDLIDQVNCSYNYAYDDGLILDAPPYSVRYDFLSGSCDILEMSMFTGGIQGFHHGYFVMNDAYEGPGTTWIEVPDYVIEEDLKFESGETINIETDYILVLSSFHQSFVVLIDKKRNKVDYLANVWMIGNYTLVDGGIEFSWYDIKQFVPLPSDGDIDIVIGFNL